MSAPGPLTAPFTSEAYASRIAPGSSAERKEISTDVIALRILLKRKDPQEARKLQSRVKLLGNFIEDPQLCRRLKGLYSSLEQQIKEEEELKKKQEQFVKEGISEFDAAEILGPLKGMVKESQLAFLKDPQERSRFIKNRENIARFLEAEMPFKDIMNLEEEQLRNSYNMARLLNQGFSFEQVQQMEKNLDQLIKNNGLDLIQTDFDDSSYKADFPNGSVSLNYVRSCSDRSVLANRLERLLKAGVSFGEIAELEDSLREAVIECGDYIAGYLQQGVKFSEIMQLNGYLRREVMESGGTLYDLLEAGASFAEIRKEEESLQSALFCNLNGLTTRIIKDWRKDRPKSWDEIVGEYRDASSRPYSPVYP